MEENVTVERAQELILERIQRISGTEAVPLLETSGRTLAQDMRAEFDNPPFDRSPVDGYACRAGDIAGASRERPVYLRVTEEIDAGDYSRRTVQPGTAVRIMTGAAIPPGCDCCVRQEDTDYGEETVAVYQPVRPLENYCFAGEDFKKGDLLLKKGGRIGYVETAVLAGMGLPSVPVYRLPRVALLTSGDEVVEPGQPLPPGRIYNSNGALMYARLRELGVRPLCLESVPDDAGAMADALRRAAGGADLIVTTGAVSVGKKDIMHAAVQKLGAERVFWRIQVKPGMPTLFSVYGDTPIVSLSGNPFGVAVTLELLIRPALEKLTGDPSLRLKRICGVMADSLDKPVRGRRLVRAFYENGAFHLPKGLHSNGVISSMAGCNCLIDTRTELKAGAQAEAILL